MIFFGFEFFYEGTEVHFTPNSFTAETIISMYISVDITDCSVVASVTKCANLFLRRFRENNFNFNLYALTTEYISWAKVPFSASLVFSLFICLNKFTLNTKYENQFLLEYWVKPLYFFFIFKSCRIFGFRSQTHLKTFTKLCQNLKLSSLIENIGQLHVA